MIMPLLKWNLRRKRKAVVKHELIGERFAIPRSTQESVDAIIYRPKEDNAPLPVLFNVHGGAWVGGDASQQDSFCAEMAERLHALVVNINYKKVDVYPFPYPQEEIRDTVIYYAAHAKELGLDRKCFSLMGYSAGGHLCAGASMLLKEAGVQPASQILAYPFLDFTGWDDSGKGSVLSRLMDDLFFPGIKKTDPLISPGAAADEKLKLLPPTILIICGQDPLRTQAETFRKRLQSLKVPVEYMEYPEAVHGFLEVNRPEYKQDAAKSPEQERLARHCEANLVATLLRDWNRRVLD